MMTSKQRVEELEALLSQLQRRFDRLQKLSRTRRETYLNARALWEASSNEMDDLHQKLHETGTALQAVKLKNETLETQLVAERLRLRYALRAARKLARVAELA